MRILSTLFFLFLFAGISTQSVAKKLPGVAVNYSNPESEIYLGSPSIAILGDGTYVVSNDYFGKIDGKSRNGSVFQSKNKGKSWEKIADVKGMFWSNLFVLNNELYLLGTDGQYGNFVIRKSTDGGHTWTTPKDKNSGLLRDDFEYHTAAMPVIIKDGRIYRATEVRNPPEKWGVNFESLVLSAPVNSDLLKAKNWTASNHIHYNPEWPVGDAWLEGNAVKTADNEIVNILRVNEKKNGDYAAIINISEEGKKAEFNPKEGFIHFPGGCKKFTIRYDEKSKRYWTLTNFKKDIGYNPERTRNCLSLASSPDLKAWTVHEHVIYNPDYFAHGFQYADWLIDGDDMVAVIRTAFDDGKVPAHNCHDSNYILFKRIKNFKDFEKSEIAKYHN
ncbi:sialidase family protein [Maribellus maritimus]|uniref:sialidase family protein n=1 Tax=Maribellus maritimus TaxID=2870838 RepID=UPI001EEB5393|nr:glycoside hydrolase [Maribellus maritimus]MCG6188561.1 glycoside hydrolase [Maribellus maritimus]